MYRPIIDNTGTITNFVAIKENISKQKEHEEENRKLEAQLQQAQRLESVGRLAGGVAHDFNNILMAIQNYAHISMMELNPDEQPYSFIAEIKKETKRAAELTNQLLAFARKQHISPKVVDLNGAIAGMIKMLQRLIGENIQLSWHPAKNIWSVKIDPVQIDQILANLCVNARDAIGNSGRIVIETGNRSVMESYCAEHSNVIPGEYVLLAVSDTGCGIDKEIMSQIFDPFFTTKGAGEGTGLGLATVYGIVQQNRGFIDVCSETGRGTTFNIYLPRHDGTEQPTQVQSVEYANPTGTETILVVEDDHDILKSLSIMLEKPGYKVLSASNAEEAIALANEYSKKIDLLLTDVVMPGMNGKELSEHLQSRFSDIKCLFMSGYAADIISRNGIIDGDIHFIKKPFSYTDIAVKVRNVLESA